MFRLIFFILLTLSFSTAAQKFKLLSGNLNALKGQSSYDIKFEYDNMIVGANMPENVYLEEKRKTWETREPGKGSEFVKRWYDHRSKRYEPAFTENFEKWGRVKLHD